MNEPLQLKHKAQIEPLLQALPLNFSEYSFANLYLFRLVHEYELHPIDDRLYIQGKSYDQKRFLLPLFDIRTASLHELQKALVSVDYLFPISEEALPIDGLQATFSENESDYIYSLEKIRSYSGRDLQGRRNLVHQFEGEYQSESHAIEDGDKRALHTVLSHWGDRHDAKECFEAIDLMQELNFVGRLYLIDNEPRGFIIGEYQHPELVTLHFAKADATIKGLYQHMYQDFAQHLPDTVKWLNWEQDLGDPGLRQSKEAYRPEQHLKKMRLSKR